MSDSPQLKGVGEALEYFLQLFTEWLHAAVHPVANCRRLLSVTSERQRLHKALRLWGTSFTVALAIDLPLYHFYGIEWSNVGFEVSSFTYMTVALVASGFAILIALRLYGIESSIADVTCIYACYVMCYQPLIVIASYFRDMRVFAVLSSARQHTGELPNMVRLLAAATTSTPDKVDFVVVGSGIGLLLLLPVTSVSSTLMAIDIAERYSVKRIKSFSAVAFATIVLILPIAAAQAIVSAYTLFFFMGVNAPSAQK